MYHQVAFGAPAAYSHYTVTPATFARQMRVLTMLGYQSISLDRLRDAVVSDTPLLKRSAVITFDDGFADAIRHVLPVLARHRLTATFFVVAGLMGRTSEWTRSTRGIEMTLADVSTLREIAGAGFTIGSHALTHRRLTRMSESEGRYELWESKRRLEHALGQEVHHLGYPYGATNETVRQAAAECGYRTACSTIEGLSSVGDDLLMLRRVHVHGGDSLADFICRLQTGFPLPRFSLRKAIQRARVTRKVSALAR